MDWRTGQISNAHDQSIWLSADEAAASAEAFGPLKASSAGPIGHTVGFVFTAGDPFFFLDIDNCATPNGWDARALDLTARLPGAAVEISASGAGLHIIGRTIAPAAPHKKKAPANAFEFYTELRFVALTGTSAVGDAGTFHDAAVDNLIRQYLVPDAGDAYADWSTAVAAGRDPRWKGPEDDATLIERAIKSKSATQAFGGRASFADLWFADERALAIAYPDPSRVYDASKADSALAQHLAFWTGKDCARILRLMHLSKLKRAKWDEREDYYLPRTILATVARQIDVLQDKPVEPGPLSMAAGAVDGRMVTGETFLNGPEQVNLFRGCVYICDRNRVLVPGGHLYDSPRFRAMYGGYSFVMDAQNSKVSHNAWEAFTESQLVRFPRADAIRFRPDLPPAEIVTEGGLTTANVWWPVETEQRDGDVTPFTNHVAKMLPDPRDYAILMAWLAAVVQYPGVKFQWAPLIQGTEGNGKTMIGRAISHAVSDRYTHIPSIEDIADGMKFTGWVERKLFILIEEIYSRENREVAQTILPLITNTRMPIQPKGIDQYTGDNRANIMALTNHKTAVPKTKKDRRWAIFFTAQQSETDLARDGMDGNYFPNLWDWFEGRNGHPLGKAIVNRFLRTCKIPDELNPATKMQRAPDTSSTDAAILLNTGTVEQEIQEAVEQGLPGFVWPWISSIKLDELLKRIHADRRIPINKRRDLLNTLGYDWHPALALVNGRINIAVSPDGGKPRIFIHQSHMLAHQLKTAAEVAKFYSDAQTQAAVGSARFGA